MQKIIIITILLLIACTAILVALPGKLCIFGGCKSEDAAELSSVLQTISPQEFAQKWNEMSKAEAVLIDVRTIGEYDAGHYEGARMIDFYSPDFKAELAKMDRNKQYFIYCRSGSRSGQALQIMRKLGFTKIYDLAGGIIGAGEILPIK